MAEVRRATAADGPALVALGRAMAAESPRYCRTNFDEAKCLQTFHALLEAPVGIVLVAEDHTGLVGMMAGFALENFFGRAINASELVLYVTPALRGSRVALRLVKAFEQWAGEMGAETVEVGVSTEVHVERTVEFYQRLGFEPTGVRLLKRVACTKGSAEAP